MWADLSGGGNEWRELLGTGRELRLESWVSWLHHSATAGLLGLATVLLTLSSYVGDPIHCEKAPGAAVTHGDTFCWVYGPRTKDLQGSCKSTGTMSCGEGEEGCSIRSHQFYQWIGLVLFMQAVCFYIPGWLWRHHEGNRVSEVLGEAGQRSLGVLLTQAPEEQEKTATEVAARLSELQGSHRAWAARLIGAELLALANLAVQILITDRFLGGGFLTLGPRLLWGEEPCHPLDRMFPIMASCSQTTWGPGYSPQTSNLICVLSANVWNQKFYLALHCWLTLMALLSLASLAYRGVTFSCPSARRCVERWEGRRMDKAGGVKSFSPTKDYADWLFYTVVLDNCNSILRDLVRKVCRSDQPLLRRSCGD